MKKKDIRQIIAHQNEELDTLYKESALLLEKYESLIISCKNANEELEKWHRRALFANKHETEAERLRSLLSKVYREAVEHGSNPGSKAQALEAIRKIIHNNYVSGTVALDRYKVGTFRTAHIFDLEGQFM